MRAMKTWKLWLLASLGAACDPLETENVGPPADAQLVLPDGAVIVAGGPQTTCHARSVTVPPAWSCSAAQIAAAQQASPSTAASVDAPPAAEPSAALAPQTCAALARDRRSALAARARASAVKLHGSALRSCLPTTRTEYVDDKGPCSPGWPSGTLDAAVGYAPSAARPTSSAPAPMSNAGSSAGAESYSTTNTQVAGVDEADFVKNDAGYVYVLGEKGLHIIDAWPAEDTRELNYLPLTDTPTRLFLSGDKLVVYLRTGTFSSAPSAAQACTYGYDCAFSAEPGGTAIAVFDVSTPAQPRELARYTLQGSYVSSRRIGRDVYTVVVDRGPTDLPISGMSLSGADANAVDTAYTSYLDRIASTAEQTPDDFFLPKLDVQQDGVQRGQERCPAVLRASAADGTDFVSIVSFDLETLGAPARTVIAAKPGFVYASGEALYMASHEGAASVVHKLTLAGKDTRYAGSGRVAGHVLNQFSMDEQNRVLRIATSLGRVPDPAVTSSVTTLGEQNGKLVELGAVTGIAPKEDLRSVRFDGDRGYLVTFRKTDPLFVLDLADPTHPKLKGELKIPGFSTYMHPMDENHLLAVGFDADDQGSFAFFNGIQLQIFDVTALDAPKLLHKTSIGTRGSASEGLLNHLAFNYFPERNLLALPMTICDGGGNGSFGTRLSFSGLMVFDVSLADGVKEHGRMPFADPAQLTSVECNSWWSGGTSLVKRSIFMGDYAIGLSDTQYKVSALSALSQPLKSLPL